MQYIWHVCVARILILQAAEGLCCNGEDLEMRHCSIIVTNDFSYMPEAAWHSG